MQSSYVARGGLTAAVVLFGICFAIVISGAPVKRAPVAVAGAPAADFLLPDAEEHMVSLEALRGRVVLLCIADPSRCGTEPLSRVAEIQREYDKEPHVTPITVLRTELEPGTIRARDLVQYLAAAGINGTRVLDGTSEVWRSYRVDNTAALFVIDRDGMIRLRCPLRGDRVAELAQARRVIDQLIPSESSDSVARR